MHPVPIPPDDDERVADLERLHIALTTPDEVFDDMTSKLARIFEVPLVYLSFTDRETQYHKSLVAPPELSEARSEPRAESVCSHVIGQNAMLVVEDLLADERFRDNPLVTRSGARFYAGTPLRAESGRPVGTLCIIDVKPRTMGSREADLLRLIAEGAMARVREQEASARLLEHARRIEHDLMQARSVQRYLLPPRRLSLPGWTVAHLYRPAADLGGDFLDVQRRPDGRVAVVVADVSGHGTPAALTAAMMKMAFTRAVAQVDEPAAVLGFLNRELIGVAPADQFMSALVATLDPGGREIWLSSAGHPYPLAIRHGGVEVVRHDNEPLLLLLPDVVYGNETRITLGAGERLLLYSDGASEATAPDGSMVGEAGLCRMVREAAAGTGDLLESIWTQLRRHVGGPLHDDVALLCMEAAGDRDA